MESNDLDLLEFLANGNSCIFIMTVKLVIEYSDNIYKRHEEKFLKKFYDLYSLLYKYSHKSLDNFYKGEIQESTLLYLS